MRIKKAEEQKLDLFFPYYVNQSRLLDIYAILNGGYSEFSEISSSVSIEKSKSGQAEGKISGGFKILDIGAGFSGNIERVNGEETGSKEKKVQTVTSILSLVLVTLKDKGYIIDIESSEVGSFIVFPAVFRINSIKSLLNEISEIVKLSSSMQKIGTDLGGIAKDVKEINSVLKSIQVMFTGEEIFFETENFAVVGNIIEDNFYQAVREDLIGTEMNCLAKVKRIFPEGTELMRNTFFKKIKDVNAKKKFINAIQGFASGDIFEFEATAISEVVGKPVYQIEVLALYQ